MDSRAGSGPACTKLRSRSVLSHPHPRQTYISRPKAELLRVAHISRGLGSDFAGGFLDLANLVTSGGNSQRTPYDDLATKLGELQIGTYDRKLTNPLL